MFGEAQTGDVAVCRQIGNESVDKTEVYVRKIGGDPPKRIRKHEADADDQVIAILGHGPQQDLPVLSARYEKGDLKTKAAGGRSTAAARATAAPRDSPKKAMRPGSISARDSRYDLAARASAISPRSEGLPGLPP